MWNQPSFNALSSIYQKASTVKSQLAKFRCKLQFKECLSLNFKNSVILQVKANVKLHSWFSELCRWIFSPKLMSTYYPNIICKIIFKKKNYLKCSLFIFIYIALGFILHTVETTNIFVHSFISATRWTLRRTSSVTSALKPNNYLVLSVKFIPWSFEFSFYCIRFPAVNPLVILLFTNKTRQ